MSGNTVFTRAIPAADRGVLEFIGADGCTGVLTSDSRCADCGRPFCEGDYVTAVLVRRPGVTQWRHTAGSCPYRIRWWRK